MKDKVKEIVDNLSQLGSEERSEVMNQVQHYFEIVGNADKMRDKQTIGESYVQFVLENRKIPFKAQVPIETVDDKYFIADFLLGNKLILEVDGKYHNTEEQKQKDERRTQILNKAGYDVLRITNEQIGTYIKMCSFFTDLQLYFSSKENKQGENISFHNWLGKDYQDFEKDFNECINE